MPISLNLSTSPSYKSLGIVREDKDVVTKVPRSLWERFFGTHSPGSLSLWQRFFGTYNPETGLPEPSPKKDGLLQRLQKIFGGAHSQETSLSKDPQEMRKLMDLKQFHPSEIFQKQTPMELKLRENHFIVHLIEK